MLRGDLDYASNALRDFERYTYNFTYKQTIHKIAGCYPKKYYDIVRDYNNKCPRQLHLLKREHINNDVELITRNVVLLKNSMELWNTAKNTSDAISPILFHYSFNCFNSFFVNSFFKWNPPRTHGHGVSPILPENVENMGIQIHKKNGLFPRILDLLTIVGVPLVFHNIIPKRNEDNIEFIENNNLYQDEKGIIPLTSILNFNSLERYRNFEIRDEERIIPTFFTREGRIPISARMNNILNSFLLIFLTSCIARYRPALWRSMLPGENKFHRDFMIKYNDAIYDYTIGENGFGFMTQVYDMMSRLSRDPFRLHDYNLMKIF